MHNADCKREEGNVVPGFPKIQNTVNIIERFSPCGVNVSYIVKRIVAYAPKEAIADLQAIEISDYAPERKGFARYIRNARKIELYVHEIIDWQPRILQKTFIFPYLAIGLALGHEIDHHVNRNLNMDRETSAETNAMKYIYPSFGILKPVAKIISWFTLVRRRK
jgi:hypothetical protein